MEEKSCQSDDKYEENESMFTVIDPKVFVKQSKMDKILEFERNAAK